jgi:WD40 repeat protein
MKKLFSTSVAFALFSLALSAQTAVWSQKANSQTREAYAVAFSANGDKVLSGSECHDARIRVWNAQTGGLDWDYLVASNTMCVMGVGFSAGANYFAAIEESGRLLVFDNTGQTPSILYNLNIGTGGSQTLDFSADNSKIAIDANDNSVRVLNITDGSLVQSLTGHSGSVKTVDWSPNGNFLVSGSTDNTFKVWDASNNYNVLHTSPNLGADISHTRISSDNSTIVVALNNGQIHWYDANTFARVDSLTCAEAVGQVDISDDKNYIAAATASGVRIFSTGDKTELANFNRPNGGRVYSVDFAANNQLATGNSNGDVTVWDLAGIITSTQQTAIYNTLLELFPNPAQTRLFVKNMADNSPFSILNSQGQTILINSYDSNGIDVSSLPAGLYILQAQGQAKMFSIH